MIIFFKTFLPTYLLLLMALLLPASGQLHPRLEAIPKDIVPTTTIARFTTMTFLQNLVVDARGRVVVNSVLDGRIWRIDEPWKDVGDVGIGLNAVVIGKVPGQAQAVSEAPNGEDGYVVIGPDLHGVTTTWHVYESGKVELIADIPEAIFPNGMESLAGGKYLFADSILGLIWEVDYFAKSSKIFFKDAVLAPNEGGWVPGANGVRVHDNKLWITNSAKETLLSLDLCEGFNIVPDSLKVVKSGIFCDDFDFDVEGNVYITTHPMDVVQKLTPNGTVSIIAGPAQEARGNTAARFDRTDKDSSYLYVVADGGLFNPSSGGLQPAPVLRLDIGIKGAVGGAKTVTTACNVKHEEL